MEFETQTSTYKLTLDQEAEKLVLVKKEITPGETSMVKPKEEFRGTRAEISPNGLTLYDGNKRIIRTSSLKSL